MISIIVPVFNTEKFLERCIQSVLNQTYADIELLLIDDGSIDKSGDICDQYAAKDSRVRVFHKTNGGVSSARNLGIDNAVGDYIGFIDSDDYIDYNMLSSLYDIIIKNNADIGYCNLYMDYGENKEIYCLVPSSADWHLMLVGWISETWTLCTTSLIKRNLFEENNLRFPTDLKYCEDLWMSLELRLNSKRVVSLNESLYYYNRCNENSITTNYHEFLLNNEKKAYEAIFSSLKRKGIYDIYKKYIYWRILDMHQNWLMDKNLFDNYYTFFPESVDELWSCPKLSYKRKFMLWCITHRLKSVGEFILSIYNILFK